MIDKTLRFLTDQINAYIERKTGSSSFGQVALKQVVNQEGNIELDSNSMGMIMVNFQEEFTLRKPINYKRVGDKFFSTNPAIHLNLIVMIVAYFSNYEEALKFISLIITFFQNNTSFNGEKYPEFNLEGVQELQVKLEPISWENLNQIWWAIGAKHMPSVPYRIRVVVLNEEETRELPASKSIETQVTRI